ncbi:ATP-binding protein [Bradyrhizobium sp. Arg68]|uniref:ATP-binding protein n=1 Tax=Bradyrhizobium ivorense TaxID=2511166 RepID=UPI001E4413F0|nr:ATP-binding protein [Bradyrhizobium ivorense]MCC8941069.1 ATP-binding protein [Bradyrhizobium ivorense]
MSSPPKIDTRKTAPRVPSGVTFQTRARTIDHLGRGQIADAPTAVSELWKNAYDAYAKDVALHIFDGSPEVALVVDDGAGMSLSTFRDRWLVIGTESKIEDSDAGPLDTFGLGDRVRQGEKGIGRLSAAFLAPVTLVLSKTVRDRFAAVLVDWRLFENPFLLIDDIRIPIVEFDEPVEVAGVLKGMADIIRSNFGIAAAEAKRDPESRVARLHAGWKRFSDFEQSQNLGSSTHDDIVAFWSQPLPIEHRHFAEWPVYAGMSTHGTALYLLDAHHELAQWVRPGPKDDDVRLEERELLIRTLSGFVDPYARKRLDFSYEVLLHFGERSRRILSSGDVFGYDDLMSLEHVIEGKFDARGRFKGKVIAFGKDLGTQEFIPRRPLPQSRRDQVGPFSFCIGTFEQQLTHTTHTEQQYEHLIQQAKDYGGLAVYRDDLRVMPYGRFDSDFFRIEERRSLHAGRAFFSFRRAFGRVAISRNANPQLKDKAGREGLVANRARNELQLLVIDLLKDFALRFFGTDSPIRQEYLEDVVARTKAARETTEKVRSVQRTELRKFIKMNEPAVAAARTRVAQLKSKLTDVVRSKRTDEVAVISSEIRNLSRQLQDYKPPAPPRKLGNLEAPFREFRDLFGIASEEMADLRAQVAKAEAELGKDEPGKVVKARVKANSDAIASFLDESERAFIARFDALRNEWRETVVVDKQRFPEAAESYVKGKTSHTALASVLGLVDQRRSEIESELRSKYAALMKALDRLKEGIDLEETLSVIDDDRAELEDRLKDIYQVAQLGIAVEIIGHELESLDVEVRRNLEKLPADVRSTRAWKLAFEAHSALTEKLRFLAPMRVAGYRNRETITGAEIAGYLEEFFKRRFNTEEISFEATKAFKAISFSDLRSRIYPVFINLLNNSLYWLQFVKDRRIVLDFQDGKAVVSDSAQGVDPDDVGRLFQLFFTRRAKGRGLGLFLSRANLAVARHHIRYATADDPRPLNGANFIIEFQGVNK